jgi:MoxR-like ATPase
MAIVIDKRNRQTSSQPQLSMTRPLLDRCRVFRIGYPEPEDLAELIRKQSEGRIYDQVVDCLIARVEAAVSKGRPPSLRRIQQLIDEASVVVKAPILH